MNRVVLVGVLSMDDSMTDAELLQLVACKRSSEAFDALCERWREPLRRHLLRQAEDAASAEDLLQETLLRIWTQADSFRERGSARSWAFQIAGNLAHNARRTRTRRREDNPTDDSFEGFAVDLPLPEELALRAESARNVRQAIDTLDEDRRELLRMVYDEDRSLAEVGETLGIPTGTVKSRLYHTRRALARLLENENEETL
ncbi:MAG: RNA polymerase sigma factor [Armatimonas sp.]